MARNLTAGMITALTAAQNRPILLFEGTFSTGALRLWTGTGPLTWDSKTWEGNGLFIAVQLATETGDIEATGITIQLSAPSAAVVSLVLGTVRMGQPGKIWLAMLDANGAVISTPYLIFSGLFDSAEIEENESAPEIVLKYETKLIELERGKTFRYTTDSQRIFSSSDRGFEYVPKIQDWDGFWGKTNAKKPSKNDKKKNQKKPTKYKW